MQKLAGITVLEYKNGALANEIRRKLHAAEQSVVITCAPSLGALCGERPELLVVAPDFALSDLRPLTRTGCGILLISGDADASFFESNCFVTYGMSPKNTLTASSISGGRLVVSLQREIVTVTGTVLERQELVTASNVSTELQLAATGAVLLLGLFREV